MSAIIRASNWGVSALCAHGLSECAEFHPCFGTCFPHDPDHRAAAIKAFNKLPLAKKLELKDKAAFLNVAIAQNDSKHPSQSAHAAPQTIQHFSKQIACCSSTLIASLMQTVL
jgi:hypothetical protein